MVSFFWLLTEIKTIYTNARIHIFCAKMHAVAFKGNPHIDKIYYFNTYSKPFNKITRTKILFFAFLSFCLNILSIFFKQIIKWV